jgi:hypothetical protein
MKNCLAWRFIASVTAICFILTNTGCITNSIIKKAESTEVVKRYEEASVSSHLLILKLQRQILNPQTEELAGTGTITIAIELSDLLEQPQTKTLSYMVPETMPESKIVPISRQPRAENLTWQYMAGNFTSQPRAKDPLRQPRAENLVCSDTQNPQLLISTEGDRDIQFKLCMEPDKYRSVDSQELSKSSRASWSYFVTPFTTIVDFALNLALIPFAVLGGIIYGIVKIFDK